MAAITRTANEGIKIKEVKTNYVSSPYSEEFYASINLTKTTAANFEAAWTIYAADSAEFWAAIDLYRTSSAEFWATIQFTSLVERLYNNIGSRGLDFATNISASGAIIEPEISSLVVTGTTAAFSINISMGELSIGTLDKVVVKLVGRDKDLVTATNPLKAREYIYIEDVSDLSRLSFFRTTYVEKDLSGSSVILSGLFESLPDSRYEMVVYVYQNTGNIYVAGSGFIIGENQYQANLSVNVNSGVIPTTVNFTSSSSSPTDVAQILWEFEPGVAALYGNTNTGKNPTHVFKKIGYYYPVVTYIFKNGFKVSQGLSGLYEE